MKWDKNLLLDDLMIPPEAWQFKNPLVRVEIIKKERKDNQVKFMERTMDEQIKIVAQEYNSSKPINDILSTLEISRNALYSRLDKAIESGLVPKLRGQGGPGSVEASKTMPNISTEDFTQRIQYKQEQAERLRQEVERLQQATAIAKALTELLGDDASALLGQLYERVSA